MGVNEDVFKLVESFYNREIDAFDMYLEGFGGVFVRRSKDGLVMGYADKRKRFAADDHYTIFFDRKKISGLHRKLADSETEVYMKYNVEYLQSTDGIRRLTQDMQKKSNMPLYMKLLLTLLYTPAIMAFQGSYKRCREAEILQDSEARKIGMKSPCIYVRLGRLERLLLPLYDKAFLMESLVNRVMYGEKPSRGFREQNFPGSQITKHERKDVR